MLAGAAYLGRYLYSAPSVLEAINLNTINLALLVLGAALHRTPARLMHAFAQATPTVWGVILQFPFYGGIAGMAYIVKREAETGLPNPMHHQGDWHGHAGIGPFKSSQQAYDTFHIGDPNQAASLQAKSRD